MVVWPPLLADDFSFVVLLAAFEVLLLLVPPPLVDLALGKSSHFGHLDDFILGPVHLSVELLLEHFDLVGTFAFSLLDTVFLHIPACLIAANDVTALLILLIIL